MDFNVEKLFKSSLRKYGLVVEARMYPVLKITQPRKRVKRILDKIKIRFSANKSYDCVVATFMTLSIVAWLYRSILDTEWERMA